MTYLLDVNALLALGFRGHIHHSHAAAWIPTHADDTNFTLATCAITELGFVRVACSSAAYATDITTAKLALMELKSNSTVPFVFINDSLDASALPAWVQNSSQTTDGHLLALAQTKGAKLATFDAGIPTAELIK